MEAQDTQEVNTEVRADTEMGRGTCGGLVGGTNYTRRNQWRARVRGQTSERSDAPVSRGGSLPMAGRRYEGAMAGAGGHWGPRSSWPEFWPSAAQLQGIPAPLSEQPAHRPGEAAQRTRVRRGVGAGSPGA